MKIRETSKIQRTTRRHVVKALATAPLLPALVVRASDHGPAPEAIPPTLQQPPTIEPSPMARALTEVVRTRYGKYLTPEQLTEVQEDIERGLRAAERLRARKLKNGDEPGFIFSAS
jgi:hypothetical protein